MNADLQPGVVQGPDSLFEVLRFPGRHGPCCTIMRLVSVGSRALSVDQKFIAGKMCNSIVHGLNLVDMLDICRPLECQVELITQEECAFLGKLLIQVDVVCSADVVVVEAGHTAGSKDLLCIDDRLFDLIIANRWGVSAQDIHGAVIVEYASQFTVLLFDDATLRAGCAVGDPGNLHGNAVGCSPVTANVHDKYGVIP